VSLPQQHIKSLPDFSPPLYIFKTVNTAEKVIMLLLNPPVPSLLGHGS